MSAHPNDPGPQQAPAAQANTADRFGGLFGRYALVFVADIASRALRFVADVVLVRHFSQVVFGQLNLAQSLAIQGMGIATCGLDTAGMRDIAKAPQATPTIAATVVMLRFVMGMFAWGATLAVTWFVPQYHDSFRMVALYGLSMFTGALTVGWVAQGRGLMHVVGLAMLATHAVYFVGVELVVLFRWPPIAVPLALVTAEAMCACGLFIWIVRAIGPLTRPLPLIDTLRFLRASLPIGGSNILRGITLASDVLVLGLFAGKSEVGLYAAAFKLYSLGLAVVALYLSVLLPDLARRTAQSRAAVMTGLLSALGRVLVAAIPMTLAGMLFAATALRLLFGPDFETATRALQILLLALPIALVGGHYHAALFAVGCQRHVLALLAIGTVIHIAAKLLLVPFFGITGAAWGTLAGEFAVMLCSWYVARTVVAD